MKRSAAIFLALCVLFSAFALPAGAGLSTVKTALRDDAKTLGILAADEWNNVTGTAAIKAAADGSLTFSAAGDGGNTVSFERTFDEPLDLSAYTELCIEQKTVSGEEKCSYMLTLYSGTTYVTETADVKAGQRSCVYFALNKTISSSVTAIQITVDGKTEQPESCTLYSVSADTGYSYRHIERFDAVSFTSLAGELEESENAITVTHSDEGAAIGVLTDHAAANENAAVQLTLDCAVGGFITLEDEAAGRSYQTALHAGESTYTFFVSNVPDKLKLSFSVGEGDAGAEFVIREMNIEPLGSYQTELGAVTGCTFDGENVVMSGTVASDAAVQYIDAMLALYRVPLGGEAEATPVATEKLSTVFELSAPAGDTSLCRYMAAIVSGEEIIPIAAPVFASSHADTSTPVAGTLAGLVDPSALDAFEVSPAVIMLDVFADKLAATQNTASAATYVYGEKLYYFRSDAFDELRADVELFSSLGYKVYLNMRDGQSDIPVTYSYGMDTVEKMCAVVSYLTEKLSGISGFVLLSDFDFSGDAASSAESAAFALGAISQAARSISAGCEIFLASNALHSPFSTLTAYYLHAYGVSGISALYTLGSEADMSRIRAAYEGAGFKRVALVAEGVEGFSAIYASAQKSGLYAVLLDGSVSGFTSSLEVTEAELVASVDEIKGTCSIWDFAGNYSTFGWLSGGGCSTPQTVSSADGRALKMETAHDEGLILGKTEGAIPLGAADGVKITLKVSGADSARLQFILGSKNSRTVYSATVEEGVATLYAPLDASGISALEYAAFALQGRETLTLEISDISLYSHDLTGEELEAALESDEAVNEETTRIYIIIAVALVVTAAVFLLLTRKKSGDEGER